MFPNESHLKVLPRHQLAVYERNLDWFRFWLQDYVDPDPLKAPQLYQRWQAMKLHALKAGASRRAATCGGGAIRRIALLPAQP